MGVMRSISRLIHGLSGKWALPTKRAFWVVDIYRCSLVCVTVFVTWLDNSNIVDYADKQQRKPICTATFKTHWCIVNCLILVYTWFYIQLIVIDPYRSRYKKGMLFGIKH